jgi:hypothetical protein
LLKDFVDTGNFQITIDDGSAATQLQPERLPGLENNTKLVMSVVTYQIAPTSQQTTVSCPLCHNDIPTRATEDPSVSERVFWCATVFIDRAL